MIDNNWKWYTNTKKKNCRFDRKVLVFKTKLTSRLVEIKKKVVFEYETRTIESNKIYNSIKFIPVCLFFRPNSSIRMTSKTPSGETNTYFNVVRWYTLYLLLNTYLVSFSFTCSKKPWVRFKIYFPLVFV